MPPRIWANVAADNPKEDRNAGSDRGTYRRTGHHPSAGGSAGGQLCAFVRTGNQLFISGQIPMGPDGIQFQGKLGAGTSIEDGQAAARLCAINLLAQAKAALGDLDKVVRLVKIVGFVNSAPDFGDSRR